jgi:hypothetical protein
MKKIEIKKIEITGPGEEVNSVRNLNYADLCMINLNHMPQEGLLPTEMTERVNIINKFKDAKIDSVVELEDKEFETLKSCNEKTRWQMLHKDIIEFNKYISEI